MKENDQERMPCSTMAPKAKTLVFAIYVFPLRSYLSIRHDTFLIVSTQEEICNFTDTPSKQNNLHYFQSL